LENEFKDIKDFSFLLEESDSINATQATDEQTKTHDAKMEVELCQKIENLDSQIKKKFQEICFSGKHDKSSAILFCEAGAGGRDAEDWAAMLLKMYQGWAKINNFPFKILYQKFGEGGCPEGRIGLKEAAAQIKGKFVYGLLRRETGIHRLIRISPFSAKELRHTSFAKIEVLPKIDIEEEKIKIRTEDIKVDTFRAGGPGGQNVNKRESAVRITHLPTGLQSASQVERSHGLNRKIALQILESKLLQIKEREKEKELKDIKGEKLSVDFGSQIRSYVLHPYQLVKDHRTGVEVSSVEKVLAGDLNKFIQAEAK
jgi:peptide chain release factor 2